MAQGCGSPPVVAFCDVLAASTLKTLDNMLVAALLPPTQVADLQDNPLLGPGELGVIKLG